MSTVRSAAVAASVAFALPASAGDRATPGFVNWESPHVHPLTATPGGARLLAVNTADARLEVFDITGITPQSVGSVPVGLDPVSVRARTATEAWVVNHISDSVSIVDLTTMNVVATLKTLDEPCDVVFAGTPQRAFVSCSQANTVMVFDPGNLSAPAQHVAIVGEDPRALDVSPDGQTVYAAIFESGNRSTILGGGGSGQGANLGFPPNAVNDAAGPYGGVNPPPNAGAGFSPPISTPNPPKVGLIVKKNAAGRWMDDNAHDWTDLVSGANSAKSGRVAGWDLVDHDVAAISTSSLSVSYATGLMNTDMALAVNPANGRVTVVGTDAANEVRFEPNVKGRFIRVKMATVDPATLGALSNVDLNPHLTYATASIPMTERVKSIGDPRAIVWTASGGKGYVAGMGSDCVIVIDPSGARAGLSPTIVVGEGPTGLVLNEADGVLYVLNRFEASVSVVSLAAEYEVARVRFDDATPAPIRIGRKHLYNTHLNSGLGQLACASCHIDARNDRLAWDLGDPSGSMQSLAGLNLGFGLIGLEPNTTSPSFEDFHPMKGPMTTQILTDIIGHEPHHWRGDRSGIEAFANAFVGLQGGDVPLNPVEMQEFEDFLATLYFPPNPFRNFDNTLPTNLPLPGHFKTGRFGSPGQPLPNGNASAGLTLYRSTARRLDNQVFACVTCHTLPTGMGTDYTRVGAVYQPLPPGPQGERHHGVVSVDGSTNVTIKIPQTRAMYEKTGFNAMFTGNTAGFGVLHDGSVDSIERFVTEPVFDVRSDTEVANLVAFMLAFSGSDLPAGSSTNPLEPPGPPSQDSHAAVGVQTTLVSEASAPAAQIALINSMLTIANSNKVGLIAKGVQAGLQRGWAYAGGNVWNSDRAGESTTTAALKASASPGSEITFTVVPKGTETRLGIDRDLDGCLDRDLADHVCGCPSDFDGDGFVSGDDFDGYVAAFDAGDASADFNGDGFVSGDDFDGFVGAFESGC